MTSHSESELAYLSIAEAARLLRRSEISPVELVEVSLARIERWSAQLNVFLTVLAPEMREGRRKLPSANSAAGARKALCTASPSR